MGVLPGDPWPERHLHAKQGVRVLICDDNRDAADTLDVLIRLHHHETAICHDGEGCLKKAKAWQPDVLLLDLGMPVMDGLEVAREVRATDWGRRVLLVAVTAWGSSEDIERTQAHGFDAHFTKPADMDKLLAVLKQAEVRS